MCVFPRDGMHSYHQFFFPRCVGGHSVRVCFSSPSLCLGPSVVLCRLVPCRTRPVGRRQCGGGVGGGSFVFVCAEWVVAGVSHPFPALSLLLLAFRRPSCLFMLLRFFRWRRSWAVLFSRPGALCGGVWLPPCFFSRYLLPSSPFIPFCFSAASLVACMFSVALHTLLCLRRLVCVSMGIPFAPYAGVRGWACSLGYTSLVTFVRALIVVLFLSVWRGVACNILVLVLAHGCSWWLRVAPSVPISCFACGGMNARIRAAYLLLPM